MVATVGGFGTYHLGSFALHRECSCKLLDSETRESESVAVHCRTPRLIGNLGIIVGPGCCASVHNSSAQERTAKYRLMCLALFRRDCVDFRTKQSCAPIPGRRRPLDRVQAATRKRDNLVDLYLSQTSFRRRQSGLTEQRSHCQC